ncbi:MAG TPA: hypothetical protein VJJ20_00280 [Candidatus Paceibacterota bacterium]
MDAKLSAPMPEDVHAWVPELGANGQVEIYATFFHEIGRYVSESVTPQKYIGLWENGLLKFQQMGTPQPEGHPTRKEVEDFIAGKLLPVSRNGSKFEPPVDPNKVVRRDPPAYLLSASVRHELDREALVDDEPEGPDAYRPSRLVKKIKTAHTEDVWEKKHQQIIAQYWTAALELRKNGRDPTAKALSLYPNLPLGQVENFIAFNPNFQEERGMTDAPVARVPETQAASIKNKKASACEAEKKSEKSTSERASAEAKKVAFWWASAELWKASDKNKPLSARSLSKKALEYLSTRSIQENSLYVEFFTLFGESERDELRFPKG